MQIKNISEWLQSSKNSIAQYAGCAQLALALDGEKAPDQHRSLATAAVNQYQAEECFKFYVDSLHNCKGKDKKCMKTYQRLGSQCYNFANTASTLVKGTEM